MAIDFRSAFHGFNREDVVHYLDYLNKKHDEVLSQLTSEAEALRQKLENVADPAETESLKARCDQLESSLSAAEEEKKALREQADALREELKQAREELKQTQEALSSTQTALSGAQEALRQAQADREADRARFGANQTRQELELEAYRRAERAERMARERADQVYRQTNGVLADATVKVEEAAEQIANISDHVMSQLDLLRSAVNGSKQALADAAAGLYSLKPKEE